MSDITGERLLSFADAAKSIPGRPHLSTLHRWRLRGVRGIKLESCLIGGRRFTSAESLKRISDATTAAADGEPPPQKSSRQTVAFERAEQELRRDGI